MSHSRVSLKLMPTVEWPRRQGNHTWAKRNNSISCLFFSGIWRTRATNRKMALLVVGRKHGQGVQQLPGVSKLQNWDTRKAAETSWVVAKNWGRVTLVGPCSIRSPHIKQNLGGTRGLCIYLYSKWERLKMNNIFCLV